MIFHIVTIFPEFFGGPFEHGVVAKAREAYSRYQRYFGIPDE